jgi:hypothetical protein
MNTTTTTDGQPTITWVLEAKFKELTDEEILKIEEKEYENYIVHNESKGKKGGCITDDAWRIWFARAILREAQEK